MTTIMKATLIIVWLAWGLSARCSGQEFTNLDFEEALIVPNDPTFGFLDWNLAAPGWNHSSGEGTSIIYYGSEHLGTSQYYLLMDATSPAYAPGTHLAGSYSLAFASGVLSGLEPGSPWVNAYVSQTGSIPLGTRSLQMLATGPFEVFVGGLSIPMYSLGGNSYGGDISGFAGTIAEVRIMNTATTVHTPTIADDIAFSPVPVPEPTTLSLLGLGSLALVIVRRRK